MRPIALYELIDRAYTSRLRGNDSQQNDTGLIYSLAGLGVVNVAGSREGALTQGASGGTGESAFTGIGLGYFRLHNRSGGAVSMGIGVRIPNRFWAAGAWDDDATTPFTDDTVDAQDVGATDFPLETTTDNDGFVVHSRVFFNAISLDVGTASVGAGAVRAARYSNAAGSGWTNFANLFLQDASTGVMATGENLVIWTPPSDWGRTQSTGLSGIPRDRFAVNVRATTAGTTAAVADSLSIYRLYHLTEAVADNGTLEVFPAAEEVMTPGDALVCLFGTANNQNVVTALVRPRE